MREYYIVIFDRNPLRSYKEFHEDFVEHPRISRWWHYIKSCYIIGTDMDEEDLAEHYIKSAKKNNIPTTHLVLKVDLVDRQGWITEEAWQWLRKNAE